MHLWPPDFNCCNRRPNTINFPQSSCSACLGGNRHRCARETGWKTSALIASPVETSSMASIMAFRVWRPNAPRRLGKEIWSTQNLIAKWITETFSNIKPWMLGHRVMSRHWVILRHCVIGTYLNTGPRGLIFWSWIQIDFRNFSIWRFIRTSGMGHKASSATDVAKYFSRALTFGKRENIIIAKVQKYE